MWPDIPVSWIAIASQVKAKLTDPYGDRWHNVPDSDEWRCVLHGKLLSLRQDPSFLYYRTYRSPSSDKNNDSDDTTINLIKHYFNLTSNLTDLYAQWSLQDPNFKKKAPQFAGVRILRQDAWEALLSFICSSNNNISRISQMVEKLCTNYGPFIGTVDDHAYHDFPTSEALTGAEVEGRLRGLGFGYRAKYIYQTAMIVSKEREKGWLDRLSNPESPALGVEPGFGGDMKPEGREGYREAHEKLLELQGVGPKVADCVSLMGLGWGEAVPVDTHGQCYLPSDMLYQTTNPAQYGKSLNATTNSAKAHTKPSTKQPTMLSETTSANSGARKPAGRIVCSSQPI